MVPNKFNIVDFGGFDLIAQYGTALPGIYDKIVDSHWNCVYIMCYGLKFGGIVIAPQYMTAELFDDHVKLNGIISIGNNDVITVIGITPQPQEPVIIPLETNINGTFQVPEGVDGYNPVVVAVPSGNYRATRVWTASVGSADASLYVQEGYWVNGNFTGESEPVVLQYTDALTPVTFTQITVQYLSSSFLWDVRPVENLIEPQSFPIGSYKRWRYDAANDYTLLSTQ